jgi:flagellar M-ring protein FliF
VILYSDLNVKDFGEMTKKLQEWNTKFATRGNSIWVNPKDKEYIKMKLAQEGVIPQGLKGWELFDTEKWTTTDFERNINKRRAIIGQMTRHIKLIDGIEDVSIEITMPNTELYVDSEKPITASVIITPAPFSDIGKNPDKIKGIINLVAYGVDGLKKENVVITDNKGNILSDFTDEDKFQFLDIAKKEFAIKERIRQALVSDVRQRLKQVVGEDKIDMNLELELNFDQQEIEKMEYLPTVIKADNPLTPYDESEVVEKIERSGKEVTEDFEGPGMMPEGPPHTEPNLPPGYKEAANRYAKYKKNERIKNYEIGQQKSAIKKSPYEIKRVSIAVWIDGTWERVYRPNGELYFTNRKIVRQYTPRTEEEMRNFTDVVKGSIGYNPARGDQVIVRNIKFDREKEFELENLKEFKRQQARRMMVVALIAILGILLLTLLVRYVQKEMERQRRLREEELARQQELLRQQALQEAERDITEPSLSLEERARLEMEENARNLAKEHPENVAKLLRTWMAD